VQHKVSAQSRVHVGDGGHAAKGQLAVLGWRELAPVARSFCLSCSTTSFVRVRNCEQSLRTRSNYPATTLELAFGVSTSGGGRKHDVGSHAGAKPGVFPPVYRCFILKQRLRATSLLFPP
jgi:hypothetical protein